MSDKDKATPELPISKDNWGQIVISIHACIIEYSH
jgi:hypothetical protein